MPSPAQLHNTTTATRHLRVPPAKLLAEVMRLSMPPHSMSATAIADHLKISERTVQRYRAMARDTASQPEPKNLSELGEGAAKYVQPLHEFLDAKRDLPEAVEVFTRDREGRIPLEELTFDVTYLARLLERAVVAFSGFYRRYQGEYDLPRHCREWIWEILINDRLLLNVPPRHNKTNIISVWYVIWRIAADRDIQVLIISQTEKLGKDKIAGPIAWNLEFNRKLIADFGRFKPYDDSSPWRPLSGEIMVEGRTREVESGDMTVQVRGKGQQVLGMEGDIIIGDDVVGRSDAWSFTEREKTSEYWHGDVMTRRSPTGSSVVVGQCLHHEDLYAELAAKVYSRGSKAGQAVWKRILYPAIIDWDTEKVLWPELWTFDRLMETYEDLKRAGDAWLFEAMYQQNPLPSSARLVVPEWIYGDDGHHFGCLDDGINGHDLRRFGQRVTVKQPEEGKSKDIWVPVVSIDPSPERMTGIIVADVKYVDDFECGIMESKRARLDMRNLVLELERIATTYHPEYLILEINAFARWFLQNPEFVDWDRKHGVRVIPHTTGRNKSDPNYGLQTLGHLFEFGKIRLPWGDAEAIASSKFLIEEATNYMPEAPKASAYTDLLMALWFIFYNAGSLIPNTYDDSKTAAKAGRGFRTPKRLSKGFRWAR